MYAVTYIYLKCWYIRGYIRWTEKRERVCVGGVEVSKKAFTHMVRIGISAAKSTNKVPSTPCRG